MSSFTCAAIDNLHPQLARYLHSSVAQSARYDESVRCYRFRKQGLERIAGGLHRTLQSTFYPHYKDNRSRRKRDVQIRGSSKAQGKRVDQEVAMMVEGRLQKKLHKMTLALLQFWKERKETLQAAQVPVELTVNQTKMTQADLITRDAQGRLVLYEIKTGAPVGFHVTQDTFQVKSVAHIRCTKKNIWQLQLAYTRMALEQSAGIPIHEAYVIQIYDHRGEGLQIDLHPQPTWTQLLPKNPVRMATAKAVPFPPQFKKNLNFVGKTKKKSAPPKSLTRTTSPLEKFSSQ